MANAPSPQPQSWLKWPRIMILAAWLVHVVAWFLPVHKDGVTFPEGFPGAQAFEFAFWDGVAAIWRYHDWQGVLTILSVVVTVLFILGSPWVALKASKKLQRTCAWIAALAFLNNADWFVRVLIEEKRDPASSAYQVLRIGYYVWWASFLLLAIGLRSLSRMPSRTE